MNDRVISELNPSYVSKIQALGYAIVKGEQSSFLIPPLRPEESWKLRFIENRWILYIHETPQISFLPEEALKFLIVRKFPSQAHRLVSPAV